jgi:D-alanyl-D-alanine carboxypeptidase
VKVRHTSPARIGLLVISLLWLVVALPLSVSAAPYAAYVMDARTGEVLHARNADTRLHPASLTKMMTLYVAFQAIENGEISLDTVVKISSKAAAEQPSKLGLRSGQRIKFRYLIRAAAVKSANDAATAIGETLEGSEAAFARRMTRTAKSLGMSKTTFKNAHGLTEQGHLSTASDMSKLGRHLLYDYPDYYNLFSRISTDAGMKTVANTNRRLLSNYKGADGIKTGYTRAAGFNLVASAERGQERIIATVFGGRSTATRNARVAELLDMGARLHGLHFASPPSQPMAALAQRPKPFGLCVLSRKACGLRPVDCAQKQRRFLCL